MSPRRTKQPLLTHEECNALIKPCCIKAMYAQKLNNKADYHAEISTLSKVCDNLISYYKELPHRIIARMEEVMTEAHNKELQEIDNKIKHLFKMRHQMPADSSYCEQQIIKITTEISMLEERKVIPVKDTIQNIIYESFDQAIKVFGTEMPANFNLILYEYHPVLSDIDSAMPKGNGDYQSKSGKNI